MNSFGLIEINEAITLMKEDIKETSQKIATDTKTSSEDIRYLETLLTTIQALEMIKKQIEKNT
jgi:hypothetical protein